MEFQTQVTSSGNVQDITTDDNIVHGSGADSGYSSHGSLTVISPNLSSHRSTSVNHLQPIYENVELKSFLSTPEITPTTRNIQKILDFHITTPTSSLKRSAQTSLCTPTKNVSPKKRRLDAKEQSRSYRNMIDNIHVDDENSENYDVVIAEFSPIKSMGNVLQERNRKFNRQGSFSSTPINEEVSIKSKSVSKTDFFNLAPGRAFRKTQSFSPSKTVRVKHTGAGIRFNTITRSIPVCNLQKTDNPARKLIDFSPKKFQALVKDCAKSSTGTGAHRSPLTHPFESFETKTSHLLRSKKFHRQNAIEKVAAPPNLSSIDMDIVYEPSTSQNLKSADLPSQNGSIINNNNLSITKTADLILNSEIVIESPIRRKSPSPIKSIKKIRRNLSFNLSQHSPKKEVDKIVFSKIPCSPPKQRIPVAKRRTSATKTSPAAKRTLFDLSPLLPKRKSYAHLKHFDIVSHLAETTTAIQIILSHLSPKDINVMYNVSQKWRAIVKNDATAFIQRNDYLTTLYKNKENLQRKKPVKTVSLDGYRKSPLKRANSVNLRKHSLVIDADRSKSDDPLLLTDEMRNQCRVKCPYCRSPSIVSKLQVKPHVVNENRIPFQRSIIDNFEHPPKPNKNPNDIAECTKKSCGFKFCVKCLCSYHNDAKCPIEPFSPIEPSDRKLLYPTGSRSKRNLRRLCSLDKF